MALLSIYVLYPFMFPHVCRSVYSYLSLYHAIGNTANQNTENPSYIRRYFIQPSHYILYRLHPLQSWEDFSLSWDPAHYGNLKRINLPVDAIWTRPVGLLNS